MNTIKAPSQTVTATASCSIIAVNHSIPIAWLAVADELRKFCNEEGPTVPVDKTEEGGSTSVLQLMRKTEGALDGCADESDRTRRAIAMLRLFHALGVVVYFHDVEGLKDKVILRPQWVLDCISYIIRDFKLHRFGRDRKAMALHSGQDWDFLLHRGILTNGLLRILWMGEEDELTFLVSLMIQLGLFAPLGPTSHLVPSVITAISNDVAMDADEIASHLGVSLAAALFEIGLDEYLTGIQKAGYLTVKSVAELSEDRR